MQSVLTDFNFFYLPHKESKFKFRAFAIKQFFPLRRTSFSWCRTRPEFYAAGFNFGHTFTADFYI